MTFCQLKETFMKTFSILLKTGNLQGYFLGLVILLLAAISYADPVKVSPLTNENRLQIDLDWSRPVSVKAQVDEKDLVSTPLKNGNPVHAEANAGAQIQGRELLLRFDSAFEAPEFEKQVSKVSDWFELIRTGYDTVLFRAKDQASYRVFTGKDKIRIEVARMLPRKAENPTYDTELLLSFTESVLEKKRPELMEKILTEYGEGFLSERPLLAARLMFALQKESSALAWMKQAESSPVLTLEEQIEIAGLYGQLGPTHPARLTLDTKKLELGIAEALQAPGLPQPRKEELVTALLDLGARRRALPYLKHLADNAGGDWADAYEETLLNLGRKEELFKFWRQRVKKPDLPDEERRQIAYQFLDAGYKAEAEQALLVLAATASPNGPDVEQLLFLWGPRPGREAKKWLLEKAGSASGDERAEWMHHLVEAGGAEEVVALLQKEPSAARSEKIFTVYLDALEDLRSGPELVAAINNLVALEHSPDKLLRYGKLAEEREQLEAAQAVYKKILQIQPGDGYALNQLGQMAFYENRWKETQDYLGRYLSTNPNDWEAYYTYAEAGYLQEDIAGAKQYYQRALEILEKSSEKTFPMEMAQADCLRRLGNPKQALTIYQSLLKKRPDDKKVRVQYISLLMEEGDFTQAQKLLISSSK